MSKTIKSKDNHKPNQFIGTFPRYMLESLSMTVLAFCAYLLAREGDSLEAISTISFIALGVQRILPSLQQIYGGWNTIKSYSSDINATLSLLKQKKTADYANISKSLPFKHKLVLSGIDFKYDDQISYTINNLSLNLIKGERIGIIGSTGSGKITAVNIIMGLLKPTNGLISLDGISLLQENQIILQAWRKSIAYVPQDCHLADKSIAQNIAFGVPDAEINMQRVYEAAKKHKFWIIF